jgi:DNA-binding phage protein
VKNQNTNLQQEGGDKMLSVKEIKEKLEDRNLSAVARNTGLPYTAIYHLMNDGGIRPSTDVVEKLSEYLGEE